MTKVNFKKADVDGFKVFYREAGPTERQSSCCSMASRAPATCFAISFPLLADRFHIVAPDLPGFGQSDMPSRDNFNYTFDNFAARDRPLHRSGRLKTGSRSTSSTTARRPVSGLR